MNYNDLQEKVIDWAVDKDLLYAKNTDKQFMKFVEEMFEFKTEMDNYHLTSDRYFYLQMKKEFGDILVTLIILAKQLNISPLECLEMAYNKISKRKGKTINGTFVKEEDL